MGLGNPGSFGADGIGIRWVSVGGAEPTAPPRAAVSTGGGHTLTANRKPSVTQSRGREKQAARDPSPGINLAPPNFSVRGLFPRNGPLTAGVESLFGSAWHPPPPAIHPAERSSPVGTSARRGSPLVHTPKQRPRLSHVSRHKARIIPAMTPAMPTIIPATLTHLASFCRKSLRLCT
jgi:hypothetical protein